MSCMTPATANATSLYYVVQETCGELPLNPTFKQLKFTGGIPSVSRDTLQSAELDGSPEITGLRLGSFQVANQTNIELKYGVHDDLLAAAMQSDWQSGATLSATSATIDATAKTLTLAGIDSTSSISVNDIIVLPSLTGYNIGSHIVTAISFSTDTVITLGSAVVENVTAGVQGLVDESGTTDLIVNDTLSVGTSRTQIAFLVKYGDLDGGVAYDLTMDAEITGFNFSVGVNALVTGSISAIGKTYQNNATLPTGATLEDTTDAEPYSGIDGSVSKDGTRLLLSTNADMTLERNATAVFEIGSKYMSHVSYGKATNTVALSTFFYNYDLEDQFIGEVDGDYTIMTRLDHKAMAFNYPSAKITEAPKEVGEGDVTMNASLQAYKAAGKVSSLIIRRVATV